ncbi:KaiC domain-containing protein [Halobaculum litoreum]|uniref:KaiC domain-containing protein n=1 Tax=Halobaculum litoreum TaxID=3031998 RepID=A0ABD5XTL9_9EURY
MSDDGDWFERALREEPGERAGGDDADDADDAGDASGADDVENAAEGGDTTDRAGGTEPTDPGESTDSDADAGRRSSERAGARGDDRDDLDADAEPADDEPFDAGEVDADADADAGADPFGGVRDDAFDGDDGLDELLGGDDTGDGGGGRGSAASTGTATSRRRTTGRPPTPTRARTRSEGWAGTRRARRTTPSARTSAPPWRTPRAAPAAPAASAATAPTRSAAARGSAAGAAAPRSTSRSSSRTSTGSTRDRGLDEMILGGVPERSLMAVIGSAGTGKTTFGLQFLNEALVNGGDAVYITLEESEEAILSTAEEKGWEYRRYADEDRLAVIAMDPIEMANSLDSIRDDISRLVTEFGADRLVLDSVSLLEMMYDHPSKRRSEVFDFARSLKAAGVTTMLTSEASEDNAYASRHGIVEYLTDAVFVLQYVRPSDFRETRLAVEIQKIRDANHSRETKPYEITDDGISVYRQANIF